MRILYVDVDSLRPDHLSCYGYHRDTSPNIDAVAARGMRFDRSYIASSPCVPSRASFVSGRFGINHGALTHWGPGSQFRFPGDGQRYDEDMPLLPRYLRQHGHETVTFSTFADRHQATWFAAGWSEARTPSLKRGSEDADEVTEQVLPWLRAHARDEDFFLHVQYWDPHRDYTVDPRWARLFERDAPPGWPDQTALDAQQSNYGPFTPSELQAYCGPGTSPNALMPARLRTVEDWVRLVNAYDGAIRFMDDQIGRLFAVLDEAGVLDETAVVITADHGEAMGEQGVYSDHVCAGEAVHRVPLIVKWPGVAGGRACAGFLYNVDLHPTLCDLLGLPVPPGWDGASFARALRGRPWAGRDHLVWDHALYTCQRAVRTDRWLFLRTYHPGLYPFDDIALFDMERDPHQEVNVAQREPGVVAAMERRLADWRSAQLGKSRDPHDPMDDVVATGPWKYVTLEPWLARLRAEGRDADAERILRRLPAAD